MEEIKKAIVFTVGNEEYGTPIEYVISIEKSEQVTRIPHLPEFVKGIVKSREELIPVIDLEQVLYNRPIDHNENTRMIVLKTSNLSFGLLVKEAKEILEIPIESLKQVGLLAYQKTKFFTNVANLDSRLITIIDPNILIESLDGINDIREYMKHKQEESENSM